MYIFDSAKMHKARYALQRAIALHLSDPNVSHVDLGLKIRERDGYRIEDNLAVRVHLYKKIRDPQKFAKFAEQYPERVVDAQRIGFDIDVPEAGYSLQQYAWWSYRRFYLYKQYYAQRLQGGISISNEWSYSFGTLGGKVVDLQTGDDMILSNWHVLSGYWHAKPGLAIYQPGVGDGGGVKDIVGRYERSAMNVQMDAAVAKLTGARILSNEQLKLGAVHSSMRPQLGQKLIKSGRGSGTTMGVITGIEGQTIMNYRGINRIVKNIVHIAQTNGEVSRPGDSGSLWLDHDSRSAVALHFAGSNDPEYALAIDMPAIEAALHVKVGMN